MLGMLAVEMDKRVDDGHFVNAYLLVANEKTGDDRSEPILSLKLRRPLANASPVKAPGGDQGCEEIFRSGHVGVVARPNY